MKRSFLWLCAVAASAQVVQTVAVVSEKPSRTIRLPGEFAPYQSVEIHSRVSGFVESIRVDRGSAVRRGQVLVTVSAPEMRVQVLEAEAKVKAVEAQRAEADARVAAAQATYERLKTASETPGAIAGNELVQAEKSLEAAKATRASIDVSAEAARAAVGPLKEMLSYLQVTAPFDGVVTERYAHPGALASPSGEPLLKLEQLSRLRLVVAVPEAEVGGIVRNARVPFTVPAYPGQTFHGTVARIGRSIEAKTRTMPVELDVQNSGGRLSPGMYAEVQWPVRTGAAALLVPPTAVTSTTARTFVIRVKNGVAEWVDVRRGPAVGDLIQVQGALSPGDRVVKAANDEIRDGSRVQAR
jgi:membrane fusion protein, multidrug efflux system